MNWLGNIIWFLCCGLWQGISWLVAGVLWSITIIGIPIGCQCFKFASLAFFPFGKDVNYGGGAMSAIANILWLLISGIPLALVTTIPIIAQVDNMQKMIPKSIPILSGDFIPKVVSRT